MKYVLAKKFEKQFSKLQKNVKIKIITQLDIFTKDPFDKKLNNHSLSGKQKGQRSINITTITEDRINFKVSENLTIGLSVTKKGLIFINDDEMNKETTLESLFSSPIIPIVNKNFYPLLLETSNRCHYLFFVCL